MIQLFACVSSLYMKRFYHQYQNMKRRMEEPFYFKPLQNKLYYNHMN